MNNTNKSILIIIPIIIFTSLYTYFRYKVFGNFEPTNMVLFIANKTIIFSAILMIPFMMSQKSKLLRTVINTFITIHILLSLYLLSPDYFPAIFKDGNMISSIGITLVGAGMMAALFHFNNISKRFTDSNGFIEIPHSLNNLLFFTFIIIHNSVMGYNNWINYQSWNGGIPPITLITTLTLIYALIRTIVYWIKK